MKKHGRAAIAVALIFAIAFSFIACDAAQGVAEHTHSLVFDSSNGSITCSACREYVFSVHFCLLFNDHLLRMQGICSSQHISGKG